MAPNPLGAIGDPPSRPTGNTTFYGSDREPGSRTHLGDDIKTIAKYVEYKSSTTPTYKLSEVSQSDRDILFSSAHGQFKLERSAGRVLVFEHVEERLVPGMDPDLARLLQSPNYYRSLTNNVDGYYGQWDNAWRLAEKDAKTAFDLATKLGEDHKTAEFKANHTFQAAFSHYTKDLLPGRVCMRNPHTTHPLPISISDDGMIICEPRHCSPTVGSAKASVSRQASAFDTVSTSAGRLVTSELIDSLENFKTGVRFNESPLGFSDSSPVSFQSSSPDNSFSSAPEDNDQRIDLDEAEMPLAIVPTLEEYDRHINEDEPEIDGGATLPASSVVSAPYHQDNRYHPAGHLGAGLMKQLQHHETLNSNDVSPTSSDASAQCVRYMSNTSMNMYSVLYPAFVQQPAAHEHAPQFAQEVVETRSEVTETSQHAISKQTVTVLHQAASIITTPPSGDQKHSVLETPQQVHAKAFSRRMKSEKLEPNGLSLCSNVTCYKVPNGLLEKLFPDNTIFPAYWTDKLGKERYLRHRINNMKFADTRFRQDTQFGNAAKKPIHVFVDMSNILIGFWDTLKALRGVPDFRRIVTPALSFKNFDTLMRRDRTAAKRCVAGSYGARDQRRMQELMDAAGALGYDTMLLQRVSSNGDRRQGREQCVDELLHLKMLQALVDLSDRPATMILATGDAKSAEYSEGFKSYVEKALQGGWNVELYAWEKSISKEWTDEEFTEIWGAQFKVFLLDRFVEELFDMTIETIELAESSK
ncbi:hypothetical protein QBC43DRAFT_337122 [Cladorrhinum sp. PSN259]|nr:hypothetical protein QBC43DRAFT_337122 [Cladorrhinum sp. PSN259]